MANTENNKKPVGRIAFMLILFSISALIYVSFVYKIVKFGP